MRKLGALLSKGAFRAVKKRIDPSDYGGAPLLGLNGCCVIGHGKLERRRHQARHPRGRRVLTERRQPQDRGELKALGAVREEREAKADA